MSSMKCDGIWAPRELSLFTATTVSLITATSLIGNVLIIIIVIKDPLKTLHTPFNYFIVNLAVADLTVGLLNGPVAIYTHIEEHFRVLTEKTAQLFHMTFFASVSASIWSLIALSVDRYIAITYPIKYRQYLSWKRCWCISAFIWLVSVSMSFTYFKVGYIDYLMVYVNSAILIAFITIIYTAVKIQKYLLLNTQMIRERLSTSSMANQDYFIKRLHSERRITRVFIMMLVVFLSVYLPASVIVYLLYFWPHMPCLPYRHWLRDLSFLIIEMNSCINPFVYAIRLKIFRKSIVHLCRNGLRDVPSTTSICSDVTITTPILSSTNDSTSSG